MDEIEKKGTVPAPTSEPTPKEPATPAPTEQKPTEPTDADYLKDLEKLEVEKPPVAPKRSEKEKALYTLKKIKERFPDLKDEEGYEPDEDKFAEVKNQLTRQQVEGIIRQNSKSEAEVKYKMHFYDNRVVKTGNIYVDADDAIWLATKERTRNALNEMKRTPPPAGAGSGAGQATPHKTITPLPPNEEKQLLRSGYRKVSEGLYEGNKMRYRFDEATKSWVGEKK